MHRSHKPVRRCHKCLLNLGDRCWAYASPRRQWHNRACRGFENERAYELFRIWEKDAVVKSRKEIRQGIFRKKKTMPHWNVKTRRAPL